MKQSSYSQSELPATVDSESGSSWQMNGPRTVRSGPIQGLCGLTVNPSVHVSLPPSQVLAYPVGRKSPHPPFITDGALRDGQYLRNVSCRQQSVRTAESPSAWLCARPTSAHLASFVVTGCCLRRVLTSPQPRRLIRRAWVTLCVRPIVRPVGCVRAFTCRRAREGRDGTISGTITHSDHSPVACARQRPRLTWTARPASAYCRRCR
jgi:hypothetical protein